MPICCICRQEKIRRSFGKRGTSIDSRCKSCISLAASIHQARKRALKYPIKTLRRKLLTTSKLLQTLIEVEESRCS